LNNQVISIKREARSKGERLNINILKEKLLLKKTNAAPSLTLIDCLTKYITDHSHKLAKSTLQNFITLKVDLEGFRQYLNLPISFESITDDFILKFQSYLFKINNNTDNTFAKKVEKLKTFLHWATSSGYNKNKAFEKFKTKRRAKEIFWLDEHELLMLENCKDISDSLKKTRDVFLFGCYTGLRYSDIQNLKSENIITGEDGHRLISTVMQKVKKPLSIPLLHQAERFLNKYNSGNGLIFNCFSNQEMNDNLKELCEAAKINTRVQRVRFQGAKRIAIESPKFSFISTHCARHSFAINSLKRGMKVEVLQKFLGHADISETMGYVKIAQLYMSEHSKKVWKETKVSKQ